MQYLLLITEVYAASVPVHPPVCLGQHSGVDPLPPRLLTLLVSVPLTFLPPPSHTHINTLYLYSHCTPLSLLSSLLFLPFLSSLPLLLPFLSSLPLLLPLLSSLPLLLPLLSSLLFLPLLSSLPLLLPTGQHFHWQWRWWAKTLRCSAPQRSMPSLSSPQSSVTFPNSSGDRESLAAGPSKVITQGGYT